MKTSRITFYFILVSWKSTARISIIVNQQSQPFWHFSDFTCRALDRRSLRDCVPSWCFANQKVFFCLPCKYGIIRSHDKQKLWVFTHTLHNMTYITNVFYLYFFFRSIVFNVKHTNCASFVSLKSIVGFLVVYLRKTQRIDTFKKDIFIDVVYLYRRVIFHLPCKNVLPYFIIFEWWLCYRYNILNSCSCFILKKLCIIIIFELLSRLCFIYTMHRDL